MCRGRYLVAMVFLGGGVLVGGAPGCALLLDMEELTHRADAAPEGSTNDASTGCPPTALFCEDFESGDLRNWSLKVAVASGTVGVVTDPVHRGTYALRAQVNPPFEKNSKASVRLDHAPFSSGIYAARAWVRLPSKLPDNTPLMSLRSSDDASLGELRLFYDGGGRLFVTTRDPNGVTTARHLTTALFPIGEWACVEWIVTLGPSGGHKVRINNATVVDVAEATFNPNMPAYNTTRIGLLLDTTGASSLDVSIDDVVLSTEPIGCD